jgi:hypothetical protein
MRVLAPLSNVLSGGPVLSRASLLPGSLLKTLSVAHSIQTATVPLQISAALAQILTDGLPILLSQAMLTMALSVQDLLALFEEYPDLPPLLRCANTNLLLSLFPSRIPSSGEPSPRGLLFPSTSMTATTTGPLDFIVATLEASFLRSAFPFPNLTFLGPF